MIGRGAIALLATGLLAAGLFSRPAAPAAQPLLDAPQLAAPGPFPVGVRRLDTVDPDRPDLTTSPGVVGRHDRTLPLTIWYPAEARSAGRSGPSARYAAHVPGPVATGLHQGAAYPNATPLRGRHFPLVIFSPGYRNWATGFSDLAEGLASHGYVVAVIDHDDADPSAAIPLSASFAMTVVSRSADQRFVIATLTRNADKGALADTYDPERIGLIGYSMGGFGALATAGAGYDAASQLYKMIPADLLAPQAEDAPLASEGPPKTVRALVAIAPWGGAPALRAWRPSALAKIKTPTLVIDGDQDDVSDYAHGVAWIYDHLTGADRYRLLYREARHNIAGDGVVSVTDRDFATVERFEEPVWRRDRILAINRHFITAFLDATLKGDTAHAAFLAPPAASADDGVWPLAPGRSVGGQFADPEDKDSKTYWPGFQRRWAVGLDFRHDLPAKR